MSAGAAWESVSVDACADALKSALESAAYYPSPRTVAAARKAASKYNQVVATALNSPNAGQTGLPPGVRALTPNERAIYESYTEAVKKALESRDATCGAIITASLSIASAYAAVIALVTPKSQQPVADTLIPFAFLAAAFASAAIGKLVGVRDRPVTLFSDANDVVKVPKRWKFWAAFAAIILIAVGVFTAGRSLVQMYGHTSNMSDSRSVRSVYLNDEGRAVVARACGAPASVLTGILTVSDGFVTVTLSDPGTCNKSRLVSLPTSAVGFIRTDH